MDYASTYKFRVAYDRQVYISKNGRSTRIRTLDPLVPNQMRYQAALHSDEFMQAKVEDEVPDLFGSRLAS
jgi:hypothetical protein